MGTCSCLPVGQRTHFAGRETEVEVEAEPSGMEEEEGEMETR